MAWYRNYYQEQFGDRVRSIVKGGTTPPPATNSSGGRGAGLAGILVVALAFGVLRGITSSSSSHPPRIKPPPVRFDDRFHDLQWQQDERLQKILDDRERQQKNRRPNDRLLRLDRVEEPPED